MPDRTDLVERRLRYIERQKRLDKGAVDVRFRGQPPQGTGPRNPHGMPQLPVGQHEVTNWPVLDLGEVPDVPIASWKLEVGGLVENKKPWTLEELYALPQEKQITRHICIEGWSAIGSWTGTPLRDFLKRIGADLTAKYVTLRCDDRYVMSIDMATALHPQTQLTFEFAGQTLPPQYGFPMKLRAPTKLGFKNPKHIGEIEIGNEFTGGYWETYGYNWFSGL